MSVIGRWGKLRFPIHRCNALRVKREIVGERLLRYPLNAFGRRIEGMHFAAERLNCAQVKGNVFAHPE